MGNLHLTSYVVPVKSKVKISQNFVAFSEYLNYTRGHKIPGLEIRSGVRYYLLRCEGKFKEPYSLIVLKRRPYKEILIRAMNFVY